MKARIAIIDDETRMVGILSMLLRKAGYQAEGFERSTAALDAFEAHPFDLVLTDLRMPEPDGLEVLAQLKKLDPKVPVILMTAYADVDTAIKAMREGAFDYVQKPFDNDELKALIARALEVTRLARENRYLKAQVRAENAIDDIIAESPAMQDVLSIVRRVAKSKSTVLVTGDSGSGKEMIARALHFHSDRVGEPFVAANCKAFADGVVESELFGHEKGAFTGAERTRRGLFERAHGGTLFLDEIGEVNEAFQAKLLRVLQERVVQRVGGDQTRPVDVRVVAATNRDLKAEVKAGRFREDLYFRLAVIPIHVKPLVERKEDILPLARHFLGRFGADRTPQLRGWTDEVEAALVAHTWPGNVRELENTMERAAVLATGTQVELSDLLLDMTGESAGEDATVTLQARMDQAAKAHIQAVLENVGGVRLEAAKRLGVERTTLYRLMKKYGVD